MKRQHNVYITIYTSFIHQKTGSKILKKHRKQTQVNLTNSTATITDYHETMYPEDCSSWLCIWFMVIFAEILEKTAMSWLPTRAISAAAELLVWQSQVHNEALPLRTTWTDIDVTTLFDRSLLYTSCTEYCIGHTSYVPIQYRRTSCSLLYWHNARCFTQRVKYVSIHIHSRSSPNSLNVNITF